MSSQTHRLYGAPVSRRSLWFGFFAGGIAFSLEGFICYTISSRACFIGQGSLGPIPPEGVRWLLAGITGLFFLLAAAGVVVSYRIWRSLSHSELARAEGHGPNEFVALCGVFMNSILAVGIVWCALILIFIDVCMREH